MSRTSCISRLRQASPAILPSLLLCDFGNLAQEVQRLEGAGVAALHLDVMDGVFVPNFTYGMTIVKALRQLTKLPLDVHLMMTQPQNYITQFHDAGADIITIHAEAVDDAQPVLDAIRDLGAVSGIAINPQTSVEEIEADIPHADLVLVMSVQAGFGGQSFDHSVLNKLKQVRALPAGRDVLLEIDGGVNNETVVPAFEHGAQLLVSGSAIFDRTDYGDAIQQMRAQLETCNERN